MTIFVKEEHQLWNAIDNMQFFDIETLQPTKPWPGIIASLMEPYNLEGAIILYLCAVENLLKHCGGDEVAARKEVSSYTVFDMFDDMLFHRTPVTMWFRGR